MNDKKYPQVTLTPSEYRDALTAAHSKLTSGEKAEIDEMADQLIRRVKQRNQRTQVSYDGALEVLAAIGRLLNTPPGKRS